jgi:glutamine amidotransferase
MSDTRKRVAIVDYEMGNLFSVKNACEHVGLRAAITSSNHDIASADAVILPGVGAFGDAIETLRRLNLINVLVDSAASQKPFLGICLGMQLMMSESHEFGRHIGLGIIPGTVVRFETPIGNQGVLKVPQVGWNRMFKTEAVDDPWAGSLLEGLSNGVFLYFVHSYYIRLEEREIGVAVTRYGNIEFCSALRYGNIFACQGHPERSGPQGLRIYYNFAAALNRN